MSTEAFIIVYNKSLDLVSRREHSRHELMQKLDKRYPNTTPIIEDVLDKLETNKISFIVFIVVFNILTRTISAIICSADILDFPIKIIFLQFSFTSWTCFLH